MTAPQRICAYYSHGPHFTRMLKHLRATYPSARITAIVPPSYPKDALRDLANEVRKTGQAHYGLRSPGALRNLIRDIRGARFDLFAVMFDSPKLRLFARASGAAQRCVYTIDGRLCPLQGAVIPALGSELLRRIQGHLLYLRLWCIVHFQSVEKK